MWQRVLDKVRRLTAAALATGRDLDTEPITLLIKETANIVLPGREHYLYRELGCQTISVVRSPLLQLESRIGCILLRIEDAALQGLGFHPDKIDPRTFTVAGEPLIRPNADLTHLDFGPFAAQSLWVQHQKHMKRTRDYSSLGKGFVRFCNYHPLFEDPVAQKIIWGCYAREHPDQVDQALIDEFVGTTLDRMECLPAPLAQALFEWDISWTPFRLLFNECPDSVIVSDFADTQTDGGKALLAATRRAVDHTTSLANTYDFDLCSDGENWDQWYAPRLLVLTIVGCAHHD